MEKWVEDGGLRKGLMTEEKYDFIVLTKSKLILKISQPSVSQSARRGEKLCKEK